MMIVNKRRREDTNDFTICRLVQPKTDERGSLQISNKLLEKYLEENTSQKSVIRRCDVASNKAIGGGTLLQRFKILEEKQHREFEQRRWQLEQSSKEDLDKAVFSQATALKKTQMLLGLNIKIKRDIYSSFGKWIELRNIVQSLNTEQNQIVLQESEKQLDTKTKNMDLYQNGMKNSQAAVKFYSNQIETLKELISYQKDKLKRLMDKAKEKDYLNREIYMKLKEVKQDNQVRTMEHQRLDHQIKRAETIIVQSKEPAILLQIQLHNEYRNCRVLQEQKHIIKQGLRCLAIVRPKSKSRNKLDYEKYYKISTHYTTISLNNAQKFRTKLENHTRDESNMELIEINHPKASLGKFGGPSLNVRFESVITENHNASLFNYNTRAKLGAEIELYLKGLIYDNLEEFYQTVGFDSPEMDKLFLIKNANPKASIWQPSALTTQQLSRESAVKRHNYLLSQNQDDYDNSETVNKQAGVILFFAEKDRRTLTELLKSINGFYLGFETCVLRVTGISYSFKEFEVNKNEYRRENFKDLEGFLAYYEKKLKAKAFRKLIILNVYIAVEYKISTSKERRLRCLSILLLSGYFLDRPADFNRLLESRGKAERCFASNKSLIAERILNYVRASKRCVVIAEIPQLIKRNSNSLPKYNCIHTNFEIINNLLK